MTQKVNSKQLKEIYFDPPSSASSFYEPSKYSHSRKSNPSFLEPKKNYQRYNEEAISQFEKFFNKHYYHPNTETDIPISNKREEMDFLDEFESLVTDRYLEQDFDSKFELNAAAFTPNDETIATLDSTAVPYNEDESATQIGEDTEPDVEPEAVSQISQLEKDLLEQSTLSAKTFTEAINLEESDAVITDELLADHESALFNIDQDERIAEDMIEDIKEEVTEEQVHDESIDEALDDDLVYLENLVSNGANGIAAAPLDSIDTLLNEIVDNEKNQISNYETDVFNANIQSLFDVDPEADLPPISQLPSTPQAVSTPATMPQTVPVTPLMAQPAPVPPSLPPQVVPAPTLPVAPTVDPLQDNKSSDTKLIEAEASPNDDEQLVDHDQSLEELDRKLAEIKTRLNDDKQKIDHDQSLEKLDSKLAEIKTKPSKLPDHNKSPEKLASNKQKVDKKIIMDAKIEPLKSDTKKTKPGEILDVAFDQEQQKKKSKLHLLDTILVILLLVIIGILLYHFRALLPFNLPFIE